MLTLDNCFHFATLHGFGRPFSRPLHAVLGGFKAVKIHAFEHITFNPILASNINFAIRATNLRPATIGNINTAFANWTV